MTDVPGGKPTPKGVRAEELARSGGRDAWALVLAANDIADAIRELTAVLATVSVPEFSTFVEAPPADLVVRIEGAVAEALAKREQDALDKFAAPKPGRRA